MVGNKQKNKIKKKVCHSGINCSQNEGMLIARLK